MDRDYKDDGDGEDNHEDDYDYKDNDEGGEMNEARWNEESGPRYGARSGAEAELSTQIEGKREKTPYDSYMIKINNITKDSGDDSLKLLIENNMRKIPHIYYKNPYGIFIAFDLIKSKKMDLTTIKSIKDKYPKSNISTFDIIRYTNFIKKCLKQ